MAAQPLVRMYSRRTCGLCDKARALILAERQRAAFRFEEVFVDGVDQLEREFGLRVPVIVVNGVEEFEIAVEPLRFRHLLKS